jgi:hypothetical protein
VLDRSCTGSNAHARDWRASSRRPARISQCGDSGTQARISRLIGLGVLPEQGPQNEPRRQHRGRHPGDPAALRGGHEFLHHGNIDGVEAGAPLSVEGPTTGSLE